MSNPQKQPTAQAEPSNANPLDYVFIYSHEYSISEFRLQYPNSTLMGIGYLRGWEYHINALGKPNLREIYYTGFQPSAQYLMPSAAPPQHAPWTGAFGLIIGMPHQEFMLLTTSHGHNYVPTTHTIPFFPQNQRYSWGHCNCIAFIDLRNTCDGGMNLLADEKNEKKWFAGLASARSLGVPQAYLHEVMRKARGAVDGFEPIFTLRDQIFLEPPRVETQFVEVDEEAEIQNQELEKEERATQITATRAIMIKNLLAQHKAPKKPPVPTFSNGSAASIQQEHQRQQSRFQEKAAEAQAQFLTQTSEQRQTTMMKKQYHNVRKPAAGSQGVEKGTKRQGVDQAGAKAKKQKTGQEDGKGESKKRLVTRPSSSLRNQISG